MSKMHSIAPLLTLALASGMACSSESTQTVNPGAAGSGMTAGTGGTPGAAGSATAGTGGTPSPGGTGGSDTAGTGGSPVAGTGGSGGEAPIAGTGGAPMGGSGGAAGDPAAALDDKVYSVPCDNQNTTGDSCQAAERDFMEVLTFGGDPGVTYNVTLHFCGPFEGRRYDDCAQGEPTGDNICIDGTPPYDGVPSYIPTYPTLGMTVSAPEHTYWLNADFVNDQINAIDYSATFPIQGGATVTIESDGGTNGGIYTAFMKSIVCDNVPGIDNQPYAGQFIHITVEGVEPAP